MPKKETKKRKAKQKPYVIWYDKMGSVGTVFAKSIVSARRKAKAKVHVTTRPKTWGK